MQELISAIRNLRGSYGIQPGAEVRAFLLPGRSPFAAAYQAEWPTVRRLARVSSPAMLPGAAMSHEGATAVLSDGSQVSIALEGPDLLREQARLRTELERVEKMLGAQQGKLANERFVARAPAEVVERERKKLADWQGQAAVLEGKLTRLASALEPDA